MIELDHIKYSIDLLRRLEPPEGYYGCFSGGKDSQVIERLAAMAGVKVDWHYSKCPDPPELLRFICDHYPHVSAERPIMPFFQIIPASLMPTPTKRCCCAYAKETACPPTRIKLIGVRQAESPRRAKAWKDHNRNSVAPIVSWSNEEVWNFIHWQKMPYCKLYDEGFSRLGCVGCPIADQPLRDMEFKRWPRYERAWMRACRSLWARHAADDVWIGKQSSAGFDNWEQHWRVWRYELRGYQARRREEAQYDSYLPCGDLDLMRYQQ